MKNSAPALESMLATLSAAARRQGLTDSAWAAAAGLRKETLSRLRGRSSCDFATLHALAQVVGSRIEVLGKDRPTAAQDGHFPATFGRDYEDRLLQLAASRTLDPESWKMLGPSFFMAGLAVMLASLRGMDRRKLLALGEHLHPGSSQPEVFSLWLARTPVRPSRFAPMLQEHLQRAA